MSFGNAPGSRDWKPWPARQPGRARLPAARPHAMAATWAAPTAESAADKPRAPRVGLGSRLRDARRLLPRSKRANQSRPTSWVLRRPIFVHVLSSSCDTQHGGRAWGGRSVAGCAQRRSRGGMGSGDSGSGALTLPIFPSRWLVRIAGPVLGSVLLGAVLAAAAAEGASLAEAIP